MKKIKLKINTQVINIIIITIVIVLVLCILPVLFLKSDTNAVLFDIGLNDITKDKNTQKKK